MNDTAAAKYVDQHYQNVYTAKTDELKYRALLMLIKEVERDTRHKCFDLAQKLSNDIFNLNHS